MQPVYVCKGVSTERSAEAQCGSDNYRSANQIRENSGHMAECKFKVGYNLKQHLIIPT